MTFQTVPYSLQNASHNANLFRQSASSPFATGGVLGGTELTVTQKATPGMGVTVGPGRAKIPGTSVAAPSGMAWTTQAMYDVLNDGNIDVAIATADATNPRIDLVYVQVQDSFYSGSSDQVVCGVVTGTPAPSPSVPATPANALALYKVAVAANATSIVNANLTRLVSPVTLIGGMALLRNATELAAWTPDDGSVAYEIDQKWTLQRIDGAWRVIAGKVPYADAFIAAAGGLAGATWITLALTDPSTTSKAVSWSSGASSRLVAQVAGRYRVEARDVLQATAWSQMRIRKNGATTYGESIAPVNSSAVSYAHTSVEIDLAVGDYVEVQAVTDTGGSLTGGLVQLRYLHP